MARSEYFATMLSRSKFSEGEIGAVDMSYCSKAIFGKIIKFLFSGSLQFGDLSFAQLLELSHMSEMILLTKIKVQVDDCINKRVEDLKKQPNKTVMIRENIDLFISGLKLVEQYKLSTYKPFFIEHLYCGLVLVGNPNEVQCSDSFKTLAFNLIKDIFLLRPVWANPLRSIERLEAFMVWLSANKVTKEETNQIVDSFNFEEFTVEELMTSVRDSGLYSAKKINDRVLYLCEIAGRLLDEKDLKRVRGHDLFESKDQHMKDNDFKIKEEDVKIEDLKDTLQDAKKN